MSIHGVLGETTSYPKSYKPETLYAIKRSLGRDEIAWDDEKLKQGVDWWHAFEVSWLNEQGVSQMAVARFGIPATSPHLVESKSLKLYLNSLNLTKFATWDSVKDTITQDLSHCVGAPVEVTLFGLDGISSGERQDTGFLIAHPAGQCIDNALDGTGLEIELVEHPDASLLAAKSATKLDSAKDYQLYSNLLRSNCPVTNQPDWGTLGIEMTTEVDIDEAKLLEYILSFRQHNGFHEQCVEQVFTDLTKAFNPSKLMVRAWYTRRGGIDINPCRVSDMSLLPQPSRLVRQ